MEIFDRPDTLPAALKHAVLAIGNFDGVHLGHQALLGMARGEADRLGAPFGILTFEPHPRRLFRPDDPPFRITPWPVKARRLALAKADFVCALPFDWPFASQSADAFIEAVLKKGLQPRHIVVGEDFHFGQLRKGTVETLRAAGLSVTAVAPVKGPDAAPYSSSLVREALAHGQIEAANRLLGWPWEIEGIVRKGDQRGRELGYPTANVPLDETLHPAYGVYAAQVQIEGEEQWRPSATNIGIRPMFELKVGQVEAHILDFTGDIYGRRLKIRPVRRLRGEAKFDSLEALIQQIDADCKQVSRYLMHNEMPSESI